MDRHHWIIVCLLALSGQAAAFFDTTEECRMTEQMTPELAAIIEISEGPKGVSYRLLGEPVTPRGRNDLGRWQRSANAVLDCTQMKIAQATEEDTALTKALQQARAWPPAAQWAGTDEDDSKARAVLDLEWAGAKWSCRRLIPKDWRICYQTHLENMETLLKDNQRENIAYRQRLWAEARTQLSARRAAPDSRAERQEACKLSGQILYAFLYDVQLGGPENIPVAFELALYRLDDVARLSGESPQTKDGPSDLLKSALLQAHKVLGAESDDFYSADDRARFTAQAESLQERCLALPAS
jgi:hypothetical protein